MEHFEPETRAERIGTIAAWCVFGVGFGLLVFLELFNHRLIAAGGWAAAIAHASLFASIATCLIAVAARAPLMAICGGVAAGAVVLEFTEIVPTAPGTMFNALYSVAGVAGVYVCSKLFGRPRADSAMAIAISLIALSLICIVSPSQIID